MCGVLMSGEIVMVVSYVCGVWGNWVVLVLE